MPLINPIGYVGPSDATATKKSVEEVNSYLARGLPGDRVLQLALGDLYSIVGQLESMVLRLERVAAGDSVIGANSGTADLVQLKQKLSSRRVNEAGAH
jgi:hypothetical protein